MNEIIMIKMASEQLFINVWRLFKFELWYKNKYLNKLLLKMIK